MQFQILYVLIDVSSVGGLNKKSLQWDKKLQTLKQ